MALRPLLFVIVAVWALVPGWTGPERLALLGDRPAVTATRVALDPGDPARRRLGQLTYMGGVELQSADPAFGGFSALAVRGDQVTLLSDGGNVVRLRLASDGGVHNARVAALPAGPGTGWEKRDRDSEALAMDPATGTAWVGFERANLIWRFDAAFTRSEGVAQPPGMGRWRANGGPETLTRRRDGSFIVLAEVGPRRRAVDRPGLVFAGDPTMKAPAFAFRYRPPSGYDPVDATELPDGLLLILLRRWRAPLRFSSMVQVIERRAIRPGAMVSGRTIAELAAPLIHDNFEGVSVTMERGQTIVWLVSDDNQSLFERTLLLKFRLDQRTRSVKTD